MLAKRGLFAGLLPLALGLAHCGPPMVLLDIDPASVPSGTKTLILETKFNGNIEQARAIDGEQRQIAIFLQQDATGVLHFTLTAAGSTGCRMAGVELQLDVPAGLSHATESAVSLSSTDTFCPLDLEITQPLYGVGGSDANDIYLAGAAATLQRCSNEASSCSPLTLDFLSQGPQGLWGAWADPGGYEYVGGSDYLFKCPSGQSTCTSLDTASVHCIGGVWGDSAGSIYVAGGVGAGACSAVAGAISRCTMGQCQQLTLPTGPCLNAVWGSDPANLFAVGAQGVMVHCQGGNCAALASGTSNDLLGIWGTSADNLYVVGDSGTAQWCHGEPLRCESTALGSPSGPNLRGIWGSDPSNIYIVGAQGTVMRCMEGLSFCRTLSAASNYELHGVWGSDAQNVYAVGELSPAGGNGPGIVLRHY